MPVENDAELRRETMEYQEACWPSFAPAEIPDRVRTISFGKRFGIPVDYAPTAKSPHRGEQLPAV